jgi:hypothetical protein
MAGGGRPGTVMSECRDHGCESVSPLETRRVLVGLARLTAGVREGSGLEQVNPDMPGKH